MISRYLYFFLFVFCATTFTYAQDRPISRFSLFSQDLKKTAEGIIHVADAPLHWSEDDFILLGSTLSAGFLLFQFDEDIDRFLRRSQNKTTQNLADIGSMYGEPITVVSIAAGLYTYGIITKDKWTRDTAVLLTTALIPAGAVQTVSKISAGRARPYMDIGEGDFKFLRGGEDYYSFVSGHTLVAVSTSLILADRIDNPYVSSLFYSFAAISAWSRMQLHNHFATDVFLGSMLGYAAVSSALKWHSDGKKTEPDRISYLFDIRPYHLGVLIYF